MTQRIFTLAELAEFTQSRLIGDPNYRITNIADLESAGAQDVSFLSNPLYEKAMLSSQAGVVFVSPQITLPKDRHFLVNDNPSRAFQQTIEALIGEALHQTTGFTGIHPSAVIHETAIIGTGANIGPHVVVDKNARIGNNVTIDAGAYIGLEVIIGNDVHIYSNVTIRERCKIGNRVIIQPGAVIGSCGFGYTTDQLGIHTKLNQVGVVILEDDVEIGANTTIDRSRFKATHIGRGSKIDNLVQIGHGVVIGQHNIIVAQTGIAGSTTTGNYVVIAGQVAVAGHLEIADKVIISGRSGVSKSITKAGKYGGVPVMPMNEHNRNSVYLRTIETYIKQIKELQSKVKALEE